MTVHSTMWRATGGHDLLDEVRAEPGLFLGICHTAAPVPASTPRPGPGRPDIECSLSQGPVTPFVPAEED